MSTYYRLSKPALADLDEIWEYIAADDPEAADRQIERLLDTMGLLAAKPLLGHGRPDLGRDIRLMACDAYVVLYRPIPKPQRAEGVEIVRVAHGARNIMDLL